MGRYASKTWGGDVSPRRRGGAIALTLLIHALLFWLLLRIAPELMPPPPPGTRTSSFDVIAEGEDAATQPRKAEARRSGGKASAPAAPNTPPPPQRETADEPGPLTLPPGIILMTRQDYAGADVARLPRDASGTGRSQASGEGEGERAGSEDGGAGGAGGSERLYDVDWYRKPTNAELSPYLRKAGMTGWGMIACRTAADYRVEDCRELDQSPVGSGLARAVREAAWQFRVLPPRVGNKPQLGVWVRIRIEYTNGQPK